MKTRSHTTLTWMFMLMLLTCISKAGADTSFANFDARAQKGERLTVVFFGASLTWGANATDPSTTSYRAVMADRLQDKYPKSSFKFYDAAIGGPGSQLGVFRLDRDVLRRKPDLVFVDFTANDDITSNNADHSASYEAIIRRLVAEAKVPVVQVLFPFKWNASATDTKGMPRHAINLAIGKAYGTPVGDAVTLVQQRIKEGKVKADELWDTDPVHPGDEGYKLFAEAAWNGFEEGVAQKMVPAAPEKMLNADTYTHASRVRISSLYEKGKLPGGWSIGKPSLGAAFHDAVMSRWLDDVVVAKNYVNVKGADGKETSTPVTPARIKAKFNGSVLMLFGEETLDSGTYRVYIDGVAVTRMVKGKTTDIFDASARNFGGSRHHTQEIAIGLDATKEHTVEIEPVFVEGQHQELRIESICVAGGKATVTPAD